MTTWESVCSQYKDEITRHYPLRPKCAKLRPLALAPARNELQENPQRTKLYKPFSLHRIGNIKAVLVQVSGILQPAGQECDKCRDGKGRWTRCVRDTGRAASGALQGSCANCYYNGGGVRCSFRSSPLTDAASETRTDLPTSTHSLSIAPPNDSTESQYSQSEPRPSLTPHEPTRSEHQVQEESVCFHVEAGFYSSHRSRPVLISRRRHQIVL